MFRDKTQYMIYILAVVLVADFIWFAYLPSRRRLEALRESRRQQTSTVTEAQEITWQIPDVRQQMNTLEEEILQWYQRVPEERTMGDFLKDIARLMTQHGLTEQVMVPGTEIGTQGLVCIPVSIHCRGTLQQLFVFYQDLQALQRLVRFEKISLQRDSARTDGHVTMQTDIVIFYRPPVT